MAISRNTPSSTAATFAAISSANIPSCSNLVNHLSDDDLTRLVRGGHDPVKVYAAYKAAVEHKGGPTVILAKTIKGYGLGEAGEGRNISHQQKKMNEKELREFRARFDIPMRDEDVVETPFYRPAKDSPEIKYLLERRKKLGGFLPKRVVSAEPLKTPHLSAFPEFPKGSGDGGVVHHHGFRPTAFQSYT